MKKLFLLLFIPVAFSCKKDKEKPKTSFDIVVNVSGSSAFSLYTNQTQLVNHPEVGGLFKNGTHLTQIYEKGTQLTVAASLPSTTRNQTIELTIKNNNTGQTLFHDLKMDVVKTKFTVD